MKLSNLYEIIFRCILFTMMFYHIFKREFKLIRPVVLIFVLSFLSAFLNAIFQIRIDTFSNFVYLMVIFMSLYLGKSFSFYDKYKWWDQLIHLLSGLVGVGFGIAIAGTNAGIIKFGILLFGFTFSITLQVFWEVLEYISDCLSHGNAQRWQKIHASNNHVSKQAIQPAGLVDTMNDFIWCIIGSVLAITVWWFII